MYLRGLLVCWSIGMYLRASARLRAFPLLEPEQFQVAEKNKINPKCIPPFSCIARQGSYSGNWKLFGNFFHFFFLSTPLCPGLLV